MLSQAAFNKKHQSKFAGLTPAQKAQRYKDYVSASRAQKVKQKRNPVRKRSPPRGAPALSDCSKLYALSLTDPWDLQTPPCVPDSLPLPSYKFAARCKTTLTIGVGGYGYIAVALRSPGFVAQSVYTSNNTYAAQYYVSFFSPDAGGAVDAKFTDASLTPFVGKPCRLVGGGVKVRYIGPELPRSGRIIAYRSPTNSAITNGLSCQQMLLNKETVSVQVDREWHGVMYKPMSFTDLSYLEGSLADSHSPFMGLFIEGAPVGSLFEADYCGWFEVTGSNLPTYTASHSDPVGMGAVTTVLATHQPESDPLSYAASVFSKIGDVAKTTLSFAPSVISGAANLAIEAAPVAASFLKTAAPAMLALM